MKILMMASGDFGAKAVTWVLENYKTDLAAVITTEKNDVSSRCRATVIPTCIYENENNLLSWLDINSITFDVGFLAWWPRILGPSVLTRASHGFFNTHPSFLPHNRGKHYNFWALVEQAPFGVTIHRVDARVDSGPIIAQCPIAYDWTDNGETLYTKAQSAMFDLFKRTFPILQCGNFIETPQSPHVGSFHFASELDAASTVELDRSYTARDLLNLLRARTFTGHPACRFVDQGEAFEVRVEIKRVK
jgi:methionyl-tRNA formyltransferase